MTLHAYYSKTDAERLGFVAEWRDKNCEPVICTAVLPEHEAHDYYYDDKEYRGIVVNFIRAVHQRKHTVKSEPGAWESLTTHYVESE